MMPKKSNAHAADLASGGRFECTREVINYVSCLEAKMHITGRAHALYDARYIILAIHVCIMHDQIIDERSLPL